MADGNLVTVASKKLKALQEGLLTDVVFLVGENDETAEEIRAVRFDLTVSSTFFANLFNSPLTLKCDGKFRLKNIEPRVFKLIVEFTHLSGQLVSEVDSLETCLKLASAADEYMIDDLAALCSKLLEDKFLGVDNVWAVLSEHIMVEAVSSVCLKFLGSKANVCLKRMEFLDASEEAVKLFCNLDEMNVESESELLVALLHYVILKENKKEKFFANAVFLAFEFWLLTLLTLPRCFPCSLSRRRPAL
ncbi:kelch repeat and BTB domain-containing protein 8-like [Cloeon dipterum]|uniref:kelch repeat and BTB domain-containing protein 8-like n=1 Tax=Cloeon dipterum TaxID=197152 RepID=UPI00321FB4D6